MTKTTILKPNSETRKKLFAETKGRSSPLDNGNAFGLVIDVDDKNQETPIICLHGGSHWLCANCATKLLQSHEARDEN